MRKALSFLLLIALIGCKPARVELDEHVVAQQPNFTHVVSAIEQYRQRVGKYPAALGDIQDLSIPPVVVPPGFEGFQAEPLRYEVSRDRSFFRLTYGIYNPADYEHYSFSTYLSLSKSWDREGHLHQLHHLEARHYGARYQQGRSIKDLDLAVQTLLDAAKSNSAYPCRNFWKEWVVAALGDGKALQQPLPNMPAVEEAVMYGAANDQSAYAFAFHAKEYRLNKKLIPVVVAIYRMAEQDREWALVQQCDSSG